MTTGSLYIVATPIGNLSDITERARDVLSVVDVIAAEDTRHSRRLLDHLGVDKPMVSYHDHNEQQRSTVLIDRLEAGEDIALISDAGTPLINDPGYRLVSAAHAAGIPVVPVPGACAAIAALSASGLATDRFSYEGFPPPKHGARVRAFEALMHETRTMVFYESSHRIIDCLRDMASVFGGDREITFARELSKTFETVRKGRLDELTAWVEADEDQRKGEIVLILDGADRVAGRTELDDLLSTLLEELPVKQAAKLASKLSGVGKNECYQRALELMG